MKNLDIFISLAVYAGRLLLNFSGVIIFGQEVFSRFDTIWWYGSFHYFISSVSNGIFPLWNPYGHGGEPFYFLYSMYRFLDPVILYPVIMAKLSSVDLLTLYQQYYLLREWIFVAGYLMIIRQFVVDPKHRILAGLIVVLTVLASSQFSMHEIDSMSWAPWICYFAIKAYRTSKKPFLLMSAFFCGILIGPSSYHFLYFITFFVFVLLGLLLFDRSRFLAFMYHQRLTILLSAILVGLMSLPLISIYLDKNMIFPVSRVFGAREEFLAGFFQTGKLNSTFYNTFLSGSKFNGASLELWDMIYKLVYFGKALTGVWMSLMILGFLSLPRRFQYVVAFVTMLTELCTLGGNTPVYYYIYSAVPFLQMIRHTVGFSYTIYLFKFPLIAFGLAWIFKLLENPKRSDVIRVFVALVIGALIEDHLKLLNWHFYPAIALLPICYLKSAKLRKLLFSCLLVMGILFTGYRAAKLPEGEPTVDRDQLVRSVNPIYPDNFVPQKLVYDPTRILAMPRPGYLLFEPLILQKDIALTTVLEPPKGQKIEDIEYLKRWTNGLASNRTIYWPQHYLQAYLDGEKNIFAFYDIMGIEKEKIRFYSSPQALLATEDKANELFLNLSTENYRLTDKAILMVDNEGSRSSKNLSTKLAELSTETQPASGFQYRILDFNANGMQLKIEAPQAGYVLYNDGFDSYWHAKVNREEKPILRANIGFKAIAVEKGESILEFEYRPALFLASVQIYLICCLAGFGMIFAYMWRAREGA